MLSLKNTISLVLSGDRQVGKTYQAKQVFDAVFPSWALVYKNPADLPTAAHPFRPMLVISCENSTAGTMAEVIAHKDCTFVPIDNLEQFEHALTILNHGHGAKYDADGDCTQKGQPFRSVFFDGWTAFTEGSKGDARGLALTEGGGTKTLDDKAKQNDERNMSRAAGAEARTAARLWASAAATHTGILMLSTAHLQEKWMPKPGSKTRERIQTGETLDLPPKPLKWLLNNCNACFLLMRKLPEIGDLDDLDSDSPPDITPTYFALTQPVNAAGFERDAIKWQDGIFAPVNPCTPRNARMPKDVHVKWNNPDLGAALLESPLLITPPAPKPSKVPTPAA